MILACTVTDLLRVSSSNADSFVRLPPDDSLSALATCSHVYLLCLDSGAVSMEDLNCVHSAVTHSIGE